MELGITLSPYCLLKSLKTKRDQCSCSLPLRRKGLFGREKTVKGAFLPLSVVKLEPTALPPGPSHLTPHRAPVPRRLSLAPLDPGQAQLFLLSVHRSFSETLSWGQLPTMPGNSAMPGLGGCLPGSGGPATQAGQQARVACSVTFGSLGRTQNQ